jgi:ferredoxin
MTTLVACTDHGHLDDLEIDGVRVVGVAELCLAPKGIVAHVPEDETRLMVGIHRREASVGAVQAVVRRLGFDPLGVGLVDLAAGAEATALRTSVLATAARTSHYPGASPEQVKLLPSGRTTRRGLLSLGAPAYTGAPRIVEDLCVADEGCRLCATRCPTDALVWQGGSVRYDPNTCVACGICLTSCPTGATVNPSADPRAIEAEIRTAIDESPEPVGIRYRCRGSIIAGEDGWHQVEVPCTGMLTVGWLLTPLVMGAIDVEAVPCQAGGCNLRNDEKLEATLADFDTVLGAFGTITAFDSDREESWLSERSTLRLIEHLALLQPDAACALDTADVGSVSIDPSTCTACQMCAQVCPTDALNTWLDSDGVHIDFDPGSCVGCAQCVATCPEIAQGAISLSRDFDAADLAIGRREVRHEPTPLCELCGKPVAPVAMLNRIEEMLGEGGTATMVLIGSRCVDCRGR